MSDTYKTMPVWVRFVKSVIEYHDHDNGTCDLSLFDEDVRIVVGLPKNLSCGRELDHNLNKYCKRDNKDSVQFSIKQEKRGFRNNERMSLRNITKAWNMSMIDEDDDQMFVEPYKPRGNLSDW